MGVYPVREVGAGDTLEDGQGKQIVTGLYKSFLANCLAADLVGDFVYTTGPKVGSLYQVSRVDIDVQAKMPAVGTIISKTSATECEVQFNALLQGVYSGLTPGARIFIGTDGRPAHTLDRPLTGRRWLQSVGVAVSATDITLHLMEPIGILPA